MITRAAGDSDTLYKKKMNECVIGMARKNGFVNKILWVLSKTTFFINHEDGKTFYHRKSSTGLYF